MNREWTNAVRRLGFTPVERPQTAVLYGMEQVLEAMFVKAAGVAERRSANGRLVLADIRYRPTTKARQYIRRATVLYYEEAGLSLPHLLVAPRNMADVLVMQLASPLGIKTVELDDDPDFNARYCAVTLEPKSTRALLTGTLCRRLCEHAGLTMRTAENRIVVFREKTIVPPRDLDEFVDEADDIVALIVGAARRFADQGINPADEFAGIQSKGGLGGRTMSPQDIDQWLGQSTPRSIPESLGRGLLLKGLLLYIMGGGILMFGSLMTLLLALLGGVAPLVVAGCSLVPLSGLALILLTFLHHRRRRRLLQEGVCREARITSVDGAGFGIGYRRCYRVRFEYQLNGRRFAGTTSEFDPAVNKAIQLQANDSGTRVLVDPNSPTHVYWIDGVTSG